MKVNEMKFTYQPDAKFEKVNPTNITTFFIWCTESCFLSSNVAQLNLAILTHTVFFKFLLHIQSIFQEMLVRVPRCMRELLLLLLRIFVAEGKAFASRPILSSSCVACVKAKPYIFRYKSYSVYSLTSYGIIFRVQWYQWRRKSTRYFMFQCGYLVLSH